MRQTFALVDLSRIKKNFLNIKKTVKDVKVMAVVKADAYGHGVKEIVKTLNSLRQKKPDYFGVALAEEAVELRKLKVKQPILVFDPVNNFNVNDYFKFKIIPTVFSKAHISILKSGFKRKKLTGIKIPVHIKIDTGMNRLGIQHNEAFDFIKYLVSQKWITIDGIYTHFATSDEKEKTFANYQLKNFNILLGKLKSAKIDYGIAHAANSGAILDMPESYFDMVRPGISLYGYYPSLDTSESIKLFPVMSIHSYVTSIKKISKAETVSYGRLFKAKNSTQIVSVPIGYADGFNRLLTNKAEAIIKKKKYNLAGRVTMDRIMFDVGNAKIIEGDKVILMGEIGKLKIDAWDWGKAIGTIPYEITCGISKRVPRVYKD